MKSTNVQTLKKTWHETLAQLQIASRVTGVRVIEKLAIKFLSAR